MDWLKQIAPTIATALGGPLAGLATEALGKALGMDSGNVAEIIKANSLTSDQVAQIKLAEIELAKQAQELGLNFETLAVDDRKSARDMQVKTQSWFPYGMAVVIVLAFISVTIMTLTGYSKIDNVLAGTLIGALGAKADQVISFFFGSSHGSQAKNEMLLNASRKGG